jgi:phage shock protein E
VRTRPLLAALAFSLLAAGCGGEGASAPAAEASPPGQATAEAPTGVAAEAEGRVLLDVRTPAEVAEGHLAGAVFIDLQGPDFRTAVAELPRDEAYFVYCRTGNRSGQAIEIMRELGFTDLVNGGGFDDLAEAGLETAS